MTVSIAHKIQNVKPSATLSVSARAAELRAEGIDVIGLSVGEPDFDTPEHIKTAGKKAIDDGFTRYTPVDGLPALKSAIIEKFKKDNNLNYKPNEVIVSTGAKQSLYNVMQATLNPGDEIIIPAPYWVSYPDMAILADAKPVIIETGVGHQFKITAEQLEEAITAKTRMLILNSPSNPSGMAYTFDELTALGDVLHNHPEILVVTDDIYEHILWSGKFVNILNACPEFKDRVVVINGVSKAFAMTGWRIGYAAGPAEVIKSMKKIQSQCTSNPCSVAQMASKAALEGDMGCVKDMVTEFKRRHNIVVEELNKIPGFHTIPVDGTFYVFPNVTEVLRAKNMKDDIELAEFLISEAKVATIPGSAFGSPGHLRLSFAASEEKLREAIRRIHESLT